MTETSAAELREEHLPTNSCENCRGPVKARRPSLTGVHFCARKECSAAKQRFYYRQRRGDGVRVAANNHEIAMDYVFQVLARLASSPRVTCEDCGRTDAVPFTAHPKPDWSGGCRALEREKSDPELAQRVVLAIWTPPAT